MRLLRLLVGVFVSIGVLLILDLVPWKSDVGQYNSVQLYLLLGITAAIGIGVASFAGAIVARTNFIGPALLIASAAWYLAVDFVQAVTQSNGDAESSMILVAKIMGFALSIGGAIVGALVAMRFCRQSEVKDSNAA